MTKTERKERRVARLQALGDAMITLALYGMIWIAIMAVVSKMLKIV